MFKGDIKLTVIAVWLGLDALPEFTFTIIIGYILGTGAKITMEWANDRITRKKTVMQIVLSLFLSYLVFLWWHGSEKTYNPGLLISLVSFFSVIIVTEGTKIFEVGFPKWLNSLANKFNIKKDDEV